MEGLKLTVGLEVHIYPRTQRKMFCSCSAEIRNAEANTMICPVCAGQPGAKPLAPNIECIRAGLRIARMLGMEVEHEPVRTMRKHYFYPDLPSNYQRTSMPFARGGELQGIGLQEIHWEEDPGQYDVARGLVDLNRSGLPLLELVTMPDMHSAEAARLFLQDLLLLLSYLDVVREGAPIKVDTNVSVTGGERVEVKNINSVAGVCASIEFEAERQRQLLSKGMKVSRETRQYDEISGETYTLRYKETLEDYRYMDDPDIMPVDISSISIPYERNPFVLREEMKQKGVPDAEARLILSEPPLLALFDTLAAKVGERFASGFIARDIKGELNFRGLQSSSINNADMKEMLAELAVQYSAGNLSNMNAHMLLRSVFDGRDIHQELKSMAGRYTEGEELRKVAEMVVSSNPDAVRRYIRGNREVINFLVGRCMKELGGRARAQELISVVEEALDRALKRAE